MKTTSHFYEDRHNGGSERSSGSLSPSSGQTDALSWRRRSKIKARLGAVIAKIFGEEPAQQIEEDLHRFKKMMELDSPHAEGLTGYA